MRKLDPRLAMLVEDVEKAAAQQQARGSVTASRAAVSAGAPAPCIAPKVEVTVWFTGNSDDLVTAGLELRRRGRTDRGSWFAIGQIAPSRLTDLAAIEHVTYVDPKEKTTPELNDSVPAIGVKALRLAHGDATGVGVVVAIIDSGFDWTHGSFRDANGRTRILHLWDRVLHKEGDEVGAQVLDPDNPNHRLDEAGVYYDRNDIDFSLGFPVTKKTPVKVRTADPPEPFDPKQPDQPYGHGTHVGGIAAGDGSTLPCCRPRGAGRYEGVAPRADIIVVRSGADDNDLPEALSFIDEKAGAQPVVVNVSQGSNAGPHDGTTRAEIAINKFVAKAGRIFVKSAGNEGDTKKHSRVTVPAQAAGPPPPVPGIVELDVIIPASMEKPDSMQIWYSQQASLEFQLTAKGAAASPTWLAQEDAKSFDVDSDTRIRAAATAHRPENQDRRILLSVPKHPDKSPLTFTMRFRNAGAAPVVVDAWIAKGTNGLTFENPTVEGTLTTPGTAFGAITVANHTLGSSSCDSGSAIHKTSSRGPIRVVPTDATAPLYAKPTLAAPGTGIVSAKPDGGCCCHIEWLEEHYQTLSGTSMAAPHVAGAIALLLQKNPTLTTVQVRDLLRDKKVTPAAGPEVEWGAGKLNALAAWEAVTAREPAPGAALAFAARAASDPATLTAPTSAMSPALRVLGDTVRRLPDGELCAALISRHFSEVRRLINSKVKVAAMWHRADGPHLLRRLAVGAVEPDAPTPLRDDRDRAYLVRMFEQLGRHGSPSLQATLDRHQSLILRMLATPLAAQLAAIRPA